MSLRGKGTICEKGDTNPPQTLKLSGTRCREEATRPRQGGETREESAWFGVQHSPVRGDMQANTSFFPGLHTTHPEQPLLQHDPSEQEKKEQTRNISQTFIALLRGTQPFDPAAAAECRRARNDQRVRNDKPVIPTSWDLPPSLLTGGPLHGPVLSRAPSPACMPFPAPQCTHG